MDFENLVRKQFTTEPFRERAVEIMQRANALEADIERRFKEIDQDPELSKQGKGNAQSRAFEQARGRLKELENLAAEWEQKHARQLEQVTEPGPDPDDTVSAIRMREIRDLLRQKDPGEILSILRDASDSGDMETIRAIEDAPRSFPLGDPDGVARFRENRLSQKFPQQMEKASNQREMAEVIRQALNFIERKYTQA